MNGKPVYKLMDGKGRVLIPKEMRVATGMDYGDIVRCSGIFIIAANHIVFKRYILDRKPKAASPPVNLEFKKLDQKVKEIESAGRYSSKELSGLIFKRAMAFYNTAEIKDYEHTTEKMKQVFSRREPLKEFDDDLFLTVVKHLTVYADRRLTFEFINGLTIDGTY